MAQEFHYFIFILNADQALFALLVFGLAFVAVRLVYRMWRGSQRCPHCGELYRTHRTATIDPIPDPTNRSALWS